MIGEVIADFTTAVRAALPRVWSEIVRVEGMDSSMWEALEPSSSGLPDSEPAGRCGHVSVSSHDGQCLVVIGGYNPDGILSDVWEFHLERREWSRVNVTGRSPPERACFRGCSGPPPMSAQRNQQQEEHDEGVYAYVFGGSDSEGNPTNDFWCLDVGNRTWHEVLPAAGLQDSWTMAEIPRARSNHAMCRMGGNLAVHGGESSCGSLLGDLWFFQPASASWRQACDNSTTAAAAAGPRPCPRSSHCLEFTHPFPAGSSADDESGVLILFGGLGRGEGGGGDAEDFEDEETMPLNDLWVRIPSTTTANSAASGSDQGAEASVVEAGGDDNRHGLRDEGSSPQVGGVWSLVLVDGIGPSPRSVAAIASPPVSGGTGGGVADLFLFGGYGYVEILSNVGMTGDGLEEDAEEGGGGESGEIIVAYIDDLWRLSLGGAGTRGTGGGSGVDGSVDGGAHGLIAPALAAEWTDEAGMGSPGESIVEGRNGHTLTWCGHDLVLFGGFVGDGFDAGVHVARPPFSSP